jgi:hypothetical protein
MQIDQVCHRDISYLVDDETTLAVLAIVTALSASDDAEVL